MGNTGLHCVVGANSYSGKKPIEAFQYLLERGAEVDAQNEYGHTALHVALLALHSLSVIKACLAISSLHSLKITDRLGRNFWHLLCLSSLLKNDQLPSDKVFELVRQFIESRDPATADDGISDREVKGRTPFHCAAISNSIELCKLFAFIDPPSCKMQDMHGCIPMNYSYEQQPNLQMFFKCFPVVRSIKDKYEMTAYDDKYLQSLRQLIKDETKDPIFNWSRGLKDVFQRPDCTMATFIESLVEAGYLNNTTHNIPTVIPGKLVEKLKIPFEERQFSVLHLWKNSNYAYISELNEVIPLHVNRFIEQLAFEMEAIDKRFQVHQQSVGSSFEGQRLICPMNMILYLFCKNSVKCVKCRDFALLLCQTLQ